MGAEPEEITRRAAWWWIDRWRKSTAYTDMTLSEQGAYRNLLDELWVRGGVLPNDERILAKISGDALEWPKVRARVMAHFYAADGGLRNSTHDEVSAESSRRAKKQRDWRDRNRSGNGAGNAGGNAGGNAAGNNDRNVTPSPGPGPGPSKGKGPDQGERQTTPASAGLVVVKPPASPDAMAAVEHWKRQTNVAPRSAKVLRTYHKRAQDRLDEGLTLENLKAAVDGAIFDDFWSKHRKNPEVLWKNHGRVLDLGALAHPATQGSLLDGAPERIRARLEAFNAQR